VNNRFDACIPFILEHEGSKFTDDPVDPGGATKWGISLRFLLQQDHDFVYHYDLDGDNDVDGDDIRLLDRARAIEIYRAKFWAPVFEKVLSLRIVCKIFDMAVNMGYTQMVKLVQRSVGATVDGVLGPKTLAAINREDSAAILFGICNAQAAFYTVLSERKPALKKYIKGWLNRANWVPPISLNTTEVPNA
jgi:lysozyme family protein